MENAHIKHKNLVTIKIERVLREPTDLHVCSQNMTHILQAMFVLVLSYYRVRSIMIAAKSFLMIITRPKIAIFKG
jgi:hypothetical protein